MPDIWIEREKERESVSVHRCEVSSILVVTCIRSAALLGRRGAQSRDKKKKKEKPKNPYGTPLWRSFRLPMLYDLTHNGGSGSERKKTKKTKKEKRKNTK